MKKLFLLFFATIMLSGTALAADVYLVATDTADAQYCARAVCLQFEGQTAVIADGAVQAGNRLAQGIDRGQLYIITDWRPMAERTGYRTLYKSHGAVLALVNDYDALARQEKVMLQPVSGDEIVTFSVPQKEIVPEPLIEEFIATLGVDTFGTFLSELSVDLTTRYSCTQEVLTARDMIAAYFNEYGLETSTPGFNNPCWNCDDVDGFNVVGVKTGTVRPDEYYLIGAHYDSTSQNSCNVAPGANDNGSGTAAVLELARAFAEVETEASIIFAAFGGEELGLLGSSRLTRQMDQSGLLEKVKGFVVLDMISFYKDTYGGLLEGSDETDVQKQTLFQIGGIARAYTTLEMSGRFNYCCSDHEPLLNNGAAGVLLIETDWSDDHNYHTTNDVFANQDLDYAVEMTKAAGATLATWAVIVPPPPPVDDDASDDDDDDDNVTDDDETDDDMVDDDDASDDDASNDDDDDDDDNGCGC